MDGRAAESKLLKTFRKFSARAVGGDAVLRRSAQPIGSEAATDVITQLAHPVTQIVCLRLIGWRYEQPISLSSRASQRLRPTYISFAIPQ